MKTNRFVIYLLLLFVLVGIGMKEPHTIANASEIKATSIPTTIYVNNAYQRTEAYKINSKGEYYYKIKDIASSVRDLSVRFQYKLSDKKLAITIGKNHVLDGTEYSAADLLTHTAMRGGAITVNGSEVKVTGYIIDGDYCITMKQAAEVLNCAFNAVPKGKGADYQLVTSYKYDSTGKRLERKLTDTQGNTSNFNRMWEGFGASYKDQIYFLGNKGLVKMKNDGSESQLLLEGKGFVNINIANDQIYYTTGKGNIHKMNLDGSDNYSIPQYAVVGVEELKSMLIIDDSVFYIYNNGKSNNIDTFDMVGRDMMVDSWMRQTLYTQKTAFIGEHRIDNFFYEDGYIYFGAQWISKFKLGDYKQSTKREVVSKWEWYQQQKLDDKTFIVMSKNPGKTDFYKYYNRFYGYIYLYRSNEDNVKVMSDQIHTFTYAFDKLLYTDTKQHLYSRDLSDSKGTTKTRIIVPGLNDGTVARFNIAGDWIICKSYADLNSSACNTVLIKLDGTTPTATY